jgi:hypothetical protein
VVHVIVVRGFLKFIMYTGGIMAVFAFMLPYWDGKPAGIDLPPQTQQFLTWGGLALVLVGYFGRRVIDRDT